MVTKSKPLPNADTVQNLLKTATNKSVQQATKVFRDFERLHDTYPKFTLEDAEKIFTECTHIFRTSTNQTARYNGLRLVKYIMTTEEFLSAHTDDIWHLYKETIFDENGNVRNAGFHLFSRYQFGLFLHVDWGFRAIKFRSKKVKEQSAQFKKILITQCLELFTIEMEYKQQHPDLEECQHEQIGGIPLGSWDTDDKFLKTIRRGLEEATKGNIIKDIAEELDYELPQHWYFDSQEDMEDEWSSEFPARVENDIAGVLIDPTGTQPMIMNDPPDPKSFSSYDEYKVVLDMREQFFEHAQTVSTILSSDKTDEEIEQELTDIGFQKHDDAPCGRTWCQERYGCVAMSLLDAMANIDDIFFQDDPELFPFLLSSDECQQCFSVGCKALPSTWLQEGTREHTVFRWFLDTMDALVFNKKSLFIEDFLDDSMQSAFMREMYFCVYSQLCNSEWKQQKEGIYLIKAFFQSSNLFDNGVSNNLLQRFEKIMSSNDNDNRECSR